MRPVQQAAVAASQFPWQSLGLILTIAQAVLDVLRNRTPAGSHMPADATPATSSTSPAALPPTAK